MDEIWQKAVETALDGQTNEAVVRALTLDGAVKCLQGRLPPPSLLEKFQNLEHLSISNIGVSSLAKFPRLTNLQKLILSDNRIADGLDFLVEAGLESLRDLDLSNNRIQFIEDLGPLARVKLVSLDLYECPITRVKDYRSRVFGLIKSLKYLDKMDAEGNERLESDDEDEEEDEDDSGSGEIDGEDRGFSMGHSSGVIDVDEEEESDAEEEPEVIEVNNQSNGFHVVVNGEDDDYNDSGEEESDDDDEVVEVQEIGDSDDEEEDMMEYQEVYDELDSDNDEEEDEVNDDEGDFEEPEYIGHMARKDEEIDGHEQGEDDDNKETLNEDINGVEVYGDFEPNEEGKDEEEDYDTEFLVQPLAHGEADVGEGSNLEVENHEDEVGDDENIDVLQPPPSSNFKRKRDDADNDGNGVNDDVDHTQSSKKLH